MVRLATAAQVEEHRDEYKELIAQEKQSILDDTLGEASEVDQQFYVDSDTHVFARVRPVLQHEATDHHFESALARGKDVMLHMLSTTLKGLPKLHTSSFKVDQAFGPTSTNEAIYQTVCKPLVNLAMKGGTATLFAYGQTGSGKTYTVGGLVHLASRDLFNGGIDNVRFFVSVCELLGGNASDLLNERASVQIMEDKFRRIQFSGCSEVEVGNAMEFDECIDGAMQIRSTHATEKNDVSSRSHMIIRIAVRNVSLVEAKDGILHMVDLAGSENARDTKHHSSDRLKETKLINTSLMTLKDCMRGRALVGQSSGYVHIPYRASKLTLAMRDCFELAVRRPIKAAIIACVSPLECDLSHSVNTMRYAAAIRVAPRQTVMEIDPDDPFNWDRERCLAFIKVASHGKAEVNDLLPEGSGTTLVEMPEHDFLSRVLKNGKMSEKQAKQFYLALWKLVVDARTRDRKKVLKVRRIVRHAQDEWAQEMIDRIKEEEEKKVSVAIFVPGEGGKAHQDA